MKRFFFYMIIAVFMASCTDSGLDGIESAEQQPSVTEAQSTISADAKDGCRSFRPNYVLGTQRNYQLEVLESNSDFINHIYLVQGSTSAFLATDDDTGTIVNLPATRPGRELVFESGFTTRMAIPPVMCGKAVPVREMPTVPFMRWWTGVTGTGMSSDSRISPPADGLRRMSPIM